jgi:hypothetical protein
VIYAVFRIGVRMLAWLIHLPALGRDRRPLSSTEAAAIMMERVIALLPRERRPVGADVLTIAGSSPAA